MKKQLIKQFAVAGLAVAAVAGVAVAASAAANGQDTAVGATSGGPSATPVQTTPEQPIATPGDASTPEPPRVSAGSGVKPVPPAQPAEHALPKDPVKACKALLASAADKPGPNAKVAARLDGAPGTILVLADSNYWAACDTAYARQNGEGSLRRPAQIATPAATAATFAVADNIIPMQGKDYEYYWAAGILPAGVTGVTYTFPDGSTAQAKIQGKYWLMQHRAASPWVQGTGGAEQPRMIKVTLSGANAKTLFLIWGVNTCAQITHGC